MKTLIYKLKNKLAIVILILFFSNINLFGQYGVNVFNQFFPEGSTINIPCGEGTIILYAGAMVNGSFNPATGEIIELPNGWNYTNPCGYSNYCNPPYYISRDFSSGGLLRLEYWKLLHQPM